MDPPMPARIPNLKKIQLKQEESANPKSLLESESESAPSKTKKIPRSSFLDKLDDDFGATPPSSPDSTNHIHKVAEIRATVIVETAAFLLTFLAGFVNAASFTLYGSPVAHVTGLSTRAAIALEEGGNFLTSGGNQILCFIGGSVMCGVLIGRHRAKVGLGMYGIALCLVSFILTLSWLSYDEDKYALARNLAALCMGLQNGIGSTFSGGLLRTTHITGFATDLGLQIGRIIGRRFRLLTSGSKINENELHFEQSELKRTQLMIVLCCGFIAGGVGGNWLVKLWKNNALWVPIFGDAFLGLLYFAYRVKVLNQNLLGGGGAVSEETKESRTESLYQTRMYSPSKGKRSGVDTTTSGKGKGTLGEW